MVDKTTGISAPQTEQGESDDSPKFITMEQANALFTARDKASRKELATIKELIQGLQQPREEEPSKAKPGKQEDSELARAFAEQKKQIQLLMDREKARESELATQKMNAALRDTFTKNGVDPRHVDHAIAYVSHRGLVRYDDDGNIQMRVNDIDYPLHDAVSAFVKTDDAKLYLAPKGTVGSGQQGPVRAAATARPQRDVESERNGQLDQLVSALMNSNISG